MTMAAGLMIGCSGQKTEETTVEEVVVEEAPKDEWIKLFDGESLAGWHKYNDGAPGKSWKAENGELIFDPSGEDGGDIVTDEEYDNFHLKYEWKISQNGNSGLIFFIHESPEIQRTYQTGPEMQVLDNDGHPDAKIISHRAGDLYDLIVSSEETVKPAGEWNQAEIIADNGKLTLVLNGVNVVETTMWTPEWEAMIADSKFKDMEGWGTYKKGRIGLQDHGDEVHFRNILLKKL